MAIVPMKRVLVFGLKPDRKAILEALQRYGSFEVIDEKEEETAALRLDTVSRQAAFQKAAAAANEALSITETYVPSEKSLFDALKGRKELSAELYYKYVLKTDEIMREANRVISQKRAVAESAAEIVRAKMAIESLEPWKSFDLPLNFKGTKKTAAFCGSFLGEASEAEILSEFAALSEKRGNNLPVEISYINTQSGQTFVMLICNKKNGAEVEAVLRDMGFSYPSAQTSVSPAKKIKELECLIAEKEEEILKAKEQIKAAATQKDAFCFLADYYAMRCEKYKVLAKVNNFRRTFFLSGYVPEGDAKNLAAVLENKYKAAVKILDAEENAPVLLKNNAFAAPVEAVVESYSMPMRGEIDPSGITAVFYYFMFGLMLGDFAYGLIMVIGCAAALLKFKAMEDGMKKTLKMFLYCGISTAFWGLMFGSCFGDAVTVVGKTFFGVDIAFSPLWFEPITKPIKMLMFSFGVGIIHLFTGLFMKLYLCIRQGKIKEAIYDVVFWYLLVGGGIVFLFSVDMFVSMTGLNFKVGKSGAEIAKWCAIVGAAGIVLTNGRSSKNPIKRIVKGLYELYNVTGYLSDILSYSRLLALGLATGVIAQVFNKIGSMGGGGIFGAILFIAVFLIGHGVNLGINLLGAYVHTNRLQFVEFFGKFYEGGGRKYKPFSEETKYYKIKEDIKL